MPLVSIVIPAYNEAETLPLFYRHLCDALSPIEPRASFQLLFVNNGSTDGTLELLSRLRATDPRINVVTLSRNFGYQAAITAGLTLARGDAVACIDADGEDPPAVLARFVEVWLAGEADVVYGIRGKRPESPLMTLGRRIYYRVTRAVADHEIVLDMAEFGLLDRRVRDAVLSTRSTFPFVRAQVGYVGFKRVGIPYDRMHRLGGRSHYNLLRNVKFGVGGILSSSTFPLRLLAYGGALLIPLSLVAVVVAAVAILRAPGLDALGGLMVVVAALLLWAVFGMAVLAIYVARIYKDQVGLPLYVVDSDRSLLDR
jgi:glycosyltransferase involved in cell wall biosynthesis